MSAGTPDTPSTTLYIIYNAKSSLLGKINYVYRKSTCPDPATKPACAACELTHGVSLRLAESAEWKATKARILHATIMQLHTDELPPALADWIRQAKVQTPAVVVQPDVASTDFQVLLMSEDLARVRLDHGAFLRLLQSRASEAGVQGIEVAAPPSDL
ncbi:hypothetical protein CIHG_10221 [Coccidioides immitis H538.4]|uniref:Uncharacterized protein n=1 Tax=Coccidioides immitis H538.4 TaxID=396776 RepID=A0A0J8S4N4_COCIT|nr:hypothetical protein CIHG_10221 [Coccidioides immitis H538.4]